MAEPAHRRWRFRAVYVALAFVIALGRLLPVDAGAGQLPGPDLILCLSLAWVLRRPDFVPVPLVAAVILMTDILFMRPLGLWTAFCVVALEVVRSRVPVLRDRSFLLEWLTVAVVVAAMTVGYALALALFVVIRPMFGLTLVEMMGTIAFYPLVVLVSVRILGVRRPASTSAVRGLGA